MMEEDDRRGGGSEDSFFKEQRNRIYDKYGLEAPKGFFDEIFG
ncbi:MAG: hypothetical protein R3B72_19745 [Polyangiaceae bacterium]